MSALLLSTSIAAASTPTSVLHQTWRGYARGFIQRDGRVIDHREGSVSTSEGQAYAMIRAVWIDDPRTFARLLRWTTDNLQGGDPATLPAWRWGRQSDD
ncbi:MAG: endo-1,4-beta-D-glucanase Y, partial [Myxococcota bacterium]